MDAKELAKILKNDGWYFDSQRGSHRYYKHPIKRAKYLSHSTVTKTSLLEHSTTYLNKLA